NAAPGGRRFHRRDPPRRSLRRHLAGVRGDPAGENRGRDGRLPHLRLRRRPARGYLDRRHDRGLLFVRHGLPRPRRHPHRQRGQGRQPRGLRRDLEAAGHDRVGVGAMATSNDLRRMALALQGTTESPHFDRKAFKVDRIYVTLAADAHTANFKFTLEEQEFKCMMAPDAFVPVPNAWGKQGWTTADLAKLSAAELKSALETAWAHAVQKGRQGSRSRRTRA